MIHKQFLLRDERSHIGYDIALGTELIIVNSLFLFSPPFPPFFALPCNDRVFHR